MLIGDIIDNLEKEFAEPLEIFDPRQDVQIIVDHNGVIEKLNISKLLFDHSSSKEISEKVNALNRLAILYSKAQSRQKLLENNKSNSSSINNLANELPSISQFEAEYNKTYH